MHVCNSPEQTKERATIPFLSQSSSSLAKQFVQHQHVNGDSRLDVAQRNSSHYTTWKKKKEGKTDRPREKPFNLQWSACDQSPNHGVTAALAIPHHLEREVLTGPASVMHLSAL